MSILFLASANPPSVTGSMIGGLCAALIAALWLVTFHKKFFISITKTLTYNPYGIYTDFSEVFVTHFWFLVKGLFVFGNRESTRLEMEQRVTNRFLEHFLRDQPAELQKLHQHPESIGHNVLITHSCRSIFYYVIRSFLEQAQRTKGEATIRIATATVHFGSFYRLLRGMEKSLNCTIEFYEIDLKAKDWTLDQDSIDEQELVKCDVIIAQHLFGVPFQQERMFALGRKHNIPIVEDCVQSGSLFGKYRGDQRSDVVIYSGGLDKTPSCFGAGFGYFRKSEHGMDLFDKCRKIHNDFPVDTWKARFIGCINQTLHLMIGKNIFFINSLIGLLAYVYVSERGDYIKWYPMGLKIRKAKSFTPFQHAESGFCRRPSVYQLMSMMHGMSEKKKARYADVAQNEVDGRDLLLKNIPSRFHAKLFPWWTKEVLQAHRDNGGISEFSWVFSTTKDEKERMTLCQFMNDEFLVALINTTWEYHEFSKLPVGREINENLVYLPNINQLKPSEIVYVAKALTKYCLSLEAKGQPAVTVGTAKKGN